MFPKTGPIRCQPVIKLGNILRPLVKFYTTRHIKPKKATAAGHTREKFVDFVKVHVVGGSGGSGCVSFRREANNEFGGPDGGSGGHGGHVIFTSTKKFNSLGHVSRELRAENGTRGRNKKRHGSNADHLYVEVPLGTIVKSPEGRELSSLEGERDYYIAARGGTGGQGNSYFASSLDTTPRYAEEGGQGEEYRMFLELKIMAHFGLIGFPNAGKSTLLRSISRARPKVAAYPFTTLHPHVGMVEYNDREQISVADIPGLIEGAHKNRGLGISFLCHIERCSCLLYVIDLSLEEPWRQLHLLKHELEQYEQGLGDRPHAVIGNKMDLEVSRENFLVMKKHTDLPVIPISAEQRLNMPELLRHMRQMYDIHGGSVSYGW